MIANSWTISSSDCCSQLNLRTLESRRQYLSVWYLHDIYHQRTCIMFNCYCKLNSISSTRNHHLSIAIKVHHHQTSILVVTHSFSITTATVFLWNSMPLHILNDPNSKSFRHSLYNYMRLNIFVSLVLFCKLVCLLYFCSCSVFFVANNLYRLCLLWMPSIVVTLIIIIISLTGLTAWAISTDHRQWWQTVVSTAKCATSHL